MPIKEHKIIRWIYYTLVISILAILIWGLGVLILPLVLGFLLAYLLTPAVDYLERKKLKRPTAAMITFICIGLIIFILVKVSTPVVSSQFTHFQDHKTEYLATIEHKIEGMKTWAETFIPKETVYSMEVQARTKITMAIADFQKKIPDILSQAVGLIATFIFVPIIGFFFLIQGSEMKKFVVALLPNRYFEMTLMILYKVNSQLGSYIRGQIFDCIILGILWTIGLSLIGVKGAIAIGIFAGIANALPYVGPVLGAIPATFILLIDPTATTHWSMPWVVLIVVNILDNAVVYPMTVGKSLQLHPLLVILGILFGGSIAGIPGMILAVPLIGMCKQAFEVLHSSLKSYRII
jgi:predicted PurR-regulated permease PerM